MNKPNTTTAMLLYCAKNGIEVSNDAGRVEAGYQFVKLDETGKIVKEWSYLDIKKLAEAEAQK